MSLEKLTEIIVLGTSKKGVKQEELDWCRQYKIDTTNTEQALLQFAYLDSQMKIAGKVLEKGDETKPIPTIEDETNAVDDNYIFFLEQLLNDFTYLILPYLKRLIKAKKTLPAPLIPKFLDYGKKQGDEFREAISLAVGNRGTFLAKFNSEWDFILTREIDWDTSNHKDRVAFLKKLRKAQPEKATKLVQPTFNEEHSKERQELLECFQVNPGEYDKVFLNHCLKDKAQLVRQIAFDLLLKMDVLQLESIKKEAAKYLIIHKGGFLTSNRIEINLPEKEDEIFKNLRSCNHNGVKMGEKAIILHKLTSRLPLDFYAISINELNKLTDKTDWKKMLLSAWQNAAIFYKNPGWAIELIPVLLKSDVPIDDDLIGVLNNEEFNTLLKELFSDYPKKFKSNEALGQIIRNSNQEINDKNAETGIQQICTYLKDIETTRAYIY